MTLLTWMLDADVTNMASGILSVIFAAVLVRRHQSWMGTRRSSRVILSPYHGIYHVSKTASLLQWATPELALGVLVTTGTSRARAQYVTHVLTHRGTHSFTRTQKNHRAVHTLLASFQPQFLNYYEK